MYFKTILIIVCSFTNVFGNSLELGTRDDAKIIKLESYNVDPTSVSVSGISSGGSFTSNFLIAHSAFLKGGGIFAGSPYKCNGTTCSSMEQRLEHAEWQADMGNIDPLENLEEKPIYIFAGGNDGSAQRNAPLLQEFFETYGAITDTNVTNPCGHGVPSLDSGIDCPRTWVPGVNNCGWSGAYHVMNHIYGNLEAPTPHGVPLKGDFIEFDQSEFTRFELLHSFAPTGYVYIPSGCRDRTKVCKLHINVHGCYILSWVIGDKYARLAGHNEVGELNDIIILHPMLTSSFIPSNVFGCWSRASDSGTKQNVDIRVVMKMVNRILNQ